MSLPDNDNWDSLIDQFDSLPNEPEGEAAPAPETKPNKGKKGKKHTPAPEPAGAMYDPGPDVLHQEEDYPPAAEADGGDDGFEDGEFGDDVDDGTEPGTAPAGDLPGQPGQEGGKKKKKRRRKKKKKGGGDPNAQGQAAPGTADFVDEQPEYGAAPKPANAPRPAPVAAQGDDSVEEGEAPGEFEDDENTIQPSAVDEAMAEESIQKKEWKVIGWNELISKLYRPG
jgi:hypothetical protein